MAVAIGTVVLLVVWLVFVFSARNPDRWLRNSRDEASSWTSGKIRSACIAAICTSTGSQKKADHASHCLTGDLVAEGRI